jgi:16S rRNA U1498 N3-methylase RsmE
MAVYFIKKPATFMQTTLNLQPGDRLLIENKAGGFYWNTVKSIAKGSGKQKIVVTLETENGETEVIECGQTVKWSVIEEDL